MKLYIGVDYSCLSSPSAAHANEGVLWLLITVTMETVMLLPICN